MRKKYIATKEELEMIKEVISEVLELGSYEFIVASDQSGSEFSMSVETFFKKLEEELT